MGTENDVKLNKSCEVQKLKNWKLEPQSVSQRKTNVTFFFIITNLIHKFLVLSHKLHLIKFLYMFRAQSAHHQEVNDVNCTYAASGIVTLCK